MNDEKTLARGWISKADSDLANALRTVDSDGPYDTAVFHVQQAIEKYLKAFLAVRGQSIPRTHDLEELAKLCMDLAPLAELASLNLAELTDFAVATRYDFDFWPTQEEARQAVAIAEQVRSIILSLVPKGARP